MSGKEDNTYLNLLKPASVETYNPKTNIATIVIAENPRVTKDVTYNFTLAKSNGMFIGALPLIKDGSISGEGVLSTISYNNDHHHVVSPTYDLSKVQLPKPGELLTQAGNFAKLSLNLNNNIYLGSDESHLHLVTRFNESITGNSLYNNKFDNQFSFSQAHRKVNGVVKRDINIKSIIWNGDKLKSDEYDINLKPIGLDPKNEVKLSYINKDKNPPFVEIREMIYEFSFDSKVGSLDEESKLYSPSSKLKFFNTKNNRRASRSDTLSLTLLEPNYLMESVKGTVVDVFGNILDLNRFPIEVGKTLTLKTSDADKSKNYLNIMAEERKSMAFHFEINAKKDLTGKDAAGDTKYINTTQNYSRIRSKFFIDIDKEGQFKINVPASSESGNIPLLTRYENLSSFSNNVGDAEGTDPNELTRIPSENIDVYADSFAQGAIQIAKKVDNSEVNVTPLDRIERFVNNNKVNIKHGTVYHDITQTCSVHQLKDHVDYLLDPPEFFDQHFTYTPLKQPLVKDKIYVGLNAGGRSGSINLDGSIELNVGANTIDRQSIWLDTAGGILANIGRDRSGVSAGVNLDGQLLVQIGGKGISNDTRFKSYDNGFIPGVLDIRVLNEGNLASVIRLDGNGVTIMSPHDMVIQAASKMTIKAGQIVMDAEEIILNDAEFKKFQGPNVHG